MRRLRQPRRSRLPHRVVLSVLVLSLGLCLHTQPASATESDHADPQTPHEGQREGGEPGCDGCGGLEGTNQSNAGVCDVPETTAYPILLADGAVLLSATDLNLPGKTFGFHLSRNYNSFYPTSEVGSNSLLTGAIGVKWRMDYGAMRIRNIDNEYTDPYNEGVVLGRSPSSKRTFTNAGTGAWTAPDGYNAKLTKATVDYDIDGDAVDEEIDVFVLEMLGRGPGHKYTFWGFDTDDLPVAQFGRIWKKTDRYGKEELTYQYDSEGKRVDTITSTQGWTVQLGYVGTTGGHARRLKTVTAYDGPIVPGNNEIAKVSYYYVDDPLVGASPDCGKYGDLVGVKVQTADSDGALSLVDWTQYRYHTDMTGHTGRTLDPVGIPPSYVWHPTKNTDYYIENDSHYLKAVYDHATLERVVADTSLNDIEEVMAKGDDWVSGSGLPTIASYASKWFEYYTTFVANNTANIVEDTWGDTDGGEDMHAAYGVTDRNELPFPEESWQHPALSRESGGVFRVLSEAVRSGCGSCSIEVASGGVTRTYYYTQIDHGTGITDDDVKMVTIEDTRSANGTWMYRSVWGINQNRLTLRRAKLVREGTAIKYWCESFLRGVSGNSYSKVTEHRTYAAHSGIDSPEAFRKFLNPSVGSNDADTVHTGAGLVRTFAHNSDGYITERRVKKGADGAAYLVGATTYGPDGPGGSAADQPAHLPIYSYAYPTKTQILSLTTGSRTDYEYDFYDAEDTQLKIRITRLPAVDTSENGPGLNDRAEIKEYYDDRGRLRWIKGPEGSISYFAYHPDTGRLAYRVTDADTTATAYLSVLANGSTAEPQYIQWLGNNGNVPPGFSTTNTHPVHLVTQWEYDALGREVQRIDPNGVKHFTRYLKNETIHFPYFDGITSTALMPIHVRRTNAAGDVTERITLDPSKAIVSGGRPTGLAAVTQADYLTWEKNAYDSDTGELKHTDRYHHIPNSGGTLDTDYYTTKHAYDERGRLTHQIQHVSGSESTGKWQLTRYSYDAMDRRVKTERAVSSTGIPSDLDAPTPAYKTIREVLYDGAPEATPGATAVGNGYVTEIRNYYEYGSTDATKKYTGHQRHLTYRGHLRGKQPIFGTKVSQSTADGPFDVYDINWLGRVIASAQYTSAPTWATVLQNDGYTAYADSVQSSRGALMRLSYDALGRLFRTAWVSVNGGSGAAGPAKTTDIYYNRRSETVATDTPGLSASEFAYDGAGRLYQSRTVTALEVNRYLSGAFNYRSPLPVPGIDTSGTKTHMTGGNDKVIALNHQQLDNAGNAIRSINWATHHDATGLNAESISKNYIQTSLYAWYDLAGRLTATASYGTNAATYTAAALPVRPTLPPSSSDTVHVATHTYQPASRTHTQTDPTAAGVQTVTALDALGRIIRTQQAEGLTDERGTLAAYDGLSNTIKIVADLDNDNTIDPSDQVTTYTYADAHDARLRTETAYPDKQDTGDVSTLTYYLDSAPLTRKDPRGSVITYSYDNRRRMTSQDLTTVGSADSSTGKIAYTYDLFGRQDRFTSYDSASTPQVLNEVQYAYTDYGSLATTYLDHDGPVSTTTTPRIDYRYDETAESNVYTKAHRPTHIIYPASTSTNLSDQTKRRNIKFKYASGIADDISRVSEIRDHDNSDLVSYDYLGDDAVTRVRYDEPSLELDSFGGSAGTYAGFDRFGRVIEHRWHHTTSSTDRDRIMYGYDRNSNRTFRENVLTSSEDELYTYDPLNRLTQAGRGTLDSAKDGFGPADEIYRQTWNLDSLGNWDRFRVHEGVSLTLILDQSRVHNAANEIDTDNDHATTGAGITATAGTNWFDPIYDAAGNMTAFPDPHDHGNGYTGVYDAWNRLVEVKDGSDTVARYKYDALGRRITKQEYDTPGSYSRDRHYYYTASRQLIEERIDTSTLPDRQYVWGHLYIDNLILRDRDTGPGGSLGVTASGLDQRHYSLHDASLNITSVTDTAGAVTERYQYTPYGERTVLDINFDPDADGLSDVDWAFGHQGLLHDTHTGLIYNRARELHPGIGRYLQRDPMGYVDGLSSYANYASMLNGLDPWGEGTQWHHLYPQAVFRKIEGTGWIDKKLNGWVMDQSDHIGGSTHTKWNADWQEWVDEKLKKGEAINERSASNQLRKMVKSSKEYKDWLAKGYPSEHDYNEWKRLDNKDALSPSKLKNKARARAKWMSKMALASVAAWAFLDGGVAIAEAASTEPCRDWYSMTGRELTTALAGGKPNCREITRSNAYTNCRENFLDAGSSVGVVSTSGSIVTQEAFDALAQRAQEACRCPDNRGAVSDLVDNAWGDE